MLLLRLQLSVINLLKQHFINDLFIFRFLSFLIRVAAYFNVDANKKNYDC